MTINGYRVSNDQIAACMRVMRGIFSFADVQRAARQAGVPEWQGSYSNPVAYILADRLLQRERKAGHIVRHKRLWREVEREQIEMRW